MEPHGNNMQSKQGKEAQQKNLLSVKRIDLFSMKWENEFHVNKCSQHLPPTPVLPQHPAAQTECTAERGGPPPEPGLGTPHRSGGKQSSSQVNHGFVLSSRSVRCISMMLGSVSSSGRVAGLLHE